MRPLCLTASNYVRFPDLRVDFVEGSTACVGSNGAGKSAVLRAIDLALFAEGSRDLAAWLGPFADQLELTLEFEHAGERYRVRRGYRGGTRGQATLDFEREQRPAHAGFSPLSFSWQPITRESTKETQAELERILGLSRRTFSASSYLAQGGAGAFTEASPADRKAILSDCLDPRGYWPAVAKKAAAERLEAERALEADRVRISEREEFLSANSGTADAEAGARMVQRTAREALERAEEHLAGTQAALAANGVAVERAKAAKAAEESASIDLSRAATALAEARDQAENLEPARAELAELEQQAGRVGELERLVEEQRQAAQAYEVASREWHARAQAVRLQEQRVDQLDRDAEACERMVAVGLARKDDLEHARDGVLRCDRCGQALGAEARAATVWSLLEETEANRARGEGLRAAARQARDEHLTMLRDTGAPPSASPAVNGYDETLREARAASEKRAALAERIRGYEEAAQWLPHHQAALMNAEQALEQRAAESARAASECQDDAALQAAGETATRAQRERRAALDDANAQVTRLEEQLARVQAALGELEALRAATGTAVSALELLRLAERAFGRDGIPTLIVESTVGQLEASANGYLQMMPTSDGTVFRVELHTQRAQKTVDHLKETLDVLVADLDGQRPYETFSGGERARVNIALRLALAILLADRRGAESRLLAVDEIEGLDSEGQAQLVEVIRSVAGRFDVVLVASHYQGIRDAFDNVIEVEKRDSVSRIAA